MTETGIDFQQVLREIDEEVRQRRAAGDFPLDMERQLDAVFARYAPPSVRSDDLEGLVEAADRTSYIDPVPPTGSRIPAVALLKRAELKLLGWFFRFIAEQVTGFGGTVVAALKILARKVEALEHAVPGADPQLLDAAARARTQPAVDAVADAVAAHLEGTTGRVLVTASGDGTLLRRLEAFDAYGVEPDLAAAEACAREGLDVRADGPVEHLRVVQDGALGGLVLVGIVDRVPLGVQVALVHRAAEVLAEGGRIAVIGTDPASWGRANPVEADLSPGRPLHAETWVHLLEGIGFTGARVVPGGDAYVVLGAR